MNVYDKIVIENKKKENMLIHKSPSKL